MQDEEEDRFPAKVGCMMDSIACLVKAKLCSTMIQRILDENSKRKLYKVDWDGVDPETGRAWSPTWVRKTYVQVCKYTTAC
jgi:hypothetical protein